MNIEDFNFHVPDELIAQNPSPLRSKSRLLVYYRDKDIITDSYTENLSDFIDSNSFLVFNNSKVIPARMKIIKKENSREGELLMLKIIDETHIEIITDKKKKYKLGTEVILPDKSIGFISRDLNAGVKILTTDKNIFNNSYFEKYGNVPLPPYIRKKPDEYDRVRYQTIYGENYGSSAAPTAGLHFDKKIFNSLSEKKIGFSYISLHVGLGTFQPIYDDNILEHKIHEENFEISDESSRLINKAFLEQKKIIPVGTTSLRAIESACINGKVESCRRDTDLFIYPSYKFKITNGIFTNFHTPKSSLFILISSFVGLKKLHEIYNYAIKKRYRFFSYGDAMLIL